MEKLKILFVVLLLSAFALPTHAVWYDVVLDPKVVAQVNANYLAIMKAEKEHTEKLDSIKARDERIAAFHVSMAAIKDLYRYSMTNISGFGEESRFYKCIFEDVIEICKYQPKVVDYFFKHPGRNSLYCISELGGIIEETTSLVNTFIDVVNNGKVSIPDTPELAILTKNKDAKHQKGDGYNFMDRNQRMDIVVTIYSRLENLKYSLYTLVTLFQYGSWQEALFYLDSEGWIKLLTSIDIVQDIAKQWEYDVKNVKDLDLF